MSRNFLYCESTDTKIYSNDVVTISSYPEIKWIAKQGWYKIGTAQKNGWYFISIADKTIIPADQVDLETVSKDIEQGTSEYRPTLKDVDTTPAEVNYIVIPGTNIRLYDSDIIKISNKPGIKWIVHSGWFIYEGVQNFGWYFESIKDGSILPVSVVDLTLCILVTTKTQGSERYDGKVVNYTRPFTDADAELLNRTFITLDTLEQRDNLDPSKIVNGRVVRVNDVYGEVAYYCWNTSTKEWEVVDWGGGIPKLIGESDNPIILSEVDPGLYRVIGYYKVTPDSDLTASPIDHLAFISGVNPTAIKIITEGSIDDYIVNGGEVEIYNTYATQSYVDDKISVIISELPDMVANVVGEIMIPIPESFIRSLFA